MISYILEICFTALVSGLILGITIALLGFIVYLVSGVIVSLVRTFKDVRAKNSVHKYVKYASESSDRFKQTNNEKDSR